MDRASSSKSRGKTQKRGLKARRTCVLAYSRQVGQKDKFWNSNCYSHLALLGKVIKAREEVILLSKKKVETRIFYLWFLVRQQMVSLKKTNAFFFFRQYIFQCDCNTAFIGSIQPALFLHQQGLLLWVSASIFHQEKISCMEKGKIQMQRFFFLPHSFSGSRQTSCMANEILVIFTTFFQPCFQYWLLRRAGNLGRDWHQWI